MFVEFSGSNPVMFFNFYIKIYENTLVNESQKLGIKQKDGSIQNVVRLIEVIPSINDFSSSFKKSFYYS